MDIDLRDSITSATYKVIESQRLGPEYHYLTIDGERFAESAKPGQFANILCGGASDAGGTVPYLRRPISICHIGTGGDVGFLFRIVGKGTQWLSRVKAGDELEILGPLGKGFSLPPNGSGTQPVQPILVGGGMGIAPMLSLAETLSGQPCLAPLILLGAASVDTIYLLDKFSLLGDVKIITDDGSSGRKGFVTELLAESLGKAEQHVQVYACGPKVMMKRVTELSIEAGAEIQVSMEEHMACGLGACLVCVCETSGGARRRVCADGPVFDGREVVWDV